MKTVTGSSIDINKFKEYCQVLFKSNSFSNFTLIPTVELEEDPIAKKLLPNEVTIVLNHFKSKAKSNMGISTFDLKKLKIKVNSIFMPNLQRDLIRLFISSKEMVGSYYVLYIQR